MERTDYFCIHFQCLYLTKNYLSNTAVVEVLFCLVVLSVVYGDFRRALKTTFELIRTWTSIFVCSGTSRQGGCVTFLSVLVYFTCRKIRLFVSRRGVGLLCRAWCLFFWNSCLQPQLSCWHVLSHKKIRFNEV